MVLDGCLPQSIPDDVFTQLQQPYNETGHIPGTRTRVSVHAYLNAYHQSKVSTE